MPYRKLEPRELTYLAVAWTVYETWQDVARYARELYGPAVASVAVEVEYLYDDMSAYYPSVASVTVKDAQGVILDPDLTTAWWQQQLGDTLAGTDDDWDRERMIEDAIDERGYDFSAPEEDTVWDMTAPPSLPFDTVYVYETSIEA